jgi:hypothetical protein
LKIKKQLPLCQKFPRQIGSWCIDRVSGFVENIYSGWGTAFLVTLVKMQTENYTTLAGVLCDFQMMLDARFKAWIQGAILSDILYLYRICLIERAAHDIEGLQFKIKNKYES